MNPAALRIALATILVLGIISGCSTNAPRYQSLQADRPIRVAVRPFTTDPEGRDYSGPTDFGRLFAEYLSGALQERGIAADIIEPGSELPEHADFVFEGTLVDIKPGSWSLRFWIGFGAGHGLINAHGRLTEIASGRVLIDETLRARSNTWQFQENILRRMCSKLARSFAKETEFAIRGK